MVVGDDKHAAGQILRQPRLEPVKDLEGARRDVAARLAVRRPGHERIPLPRGTELGVARPAFVSAEPLPGPVVDLHEPGLDLRLPIRSDDAGYLRERLPATPGGRGDQAQVVSGHLDELLREPLPQQRGQFPSLGGQRWIGPLAQVAPAGARLGRAVTDEQQVSHLRPSLTRAWADSLRSGLAAAYAMLCRPRPNLPR